MSVEGLKHAQEQNHRQYHVLMKIILEYAQVQEPKHAILLITNMESVLFLLQQTQEMQLALEKSAGMTDAEDIAEKGQETRDAQKDMTAMVKGNA